MIPLTTSSTNAMDKQLTRWARMGQLIDGRWVPKYTRVLMWGQWHDLVPGKAHRVKFDKQDPRKSRIIVVED